MLKPIRKTATGLIEYWDTKNKLIVLGSSQSSKDLANKDTNQIKNDNQNGVINTVLDLTTLDADRLREFANQHGIEIPGNMKKEETIRNYIAEQLTAADAE